MFLGFGFVFMQKASKSLESLQQVQRVLFSTIDVTANSILDKTLG